MPGKIPGSELWLLPDASGCFGAPLLLGVWPLRLYIFKWLRNKQERVRRDDSPVLVACVRP